LVITSDDSLFIDDRVRLDEISIDKNGCFSLIVEHIPN